MKQLSLHPYNPKITTTSDGSHSIYVADLDEHCHSQHGAVQEAAHVFIKHGLDFCRNAGAAACRIFEVGFGTGLNALLSAVCAHAHALPIYYYTIELYPLGSDIIGSLNYPEQAGAIDPSEIFKAIQAVPWGIESCTSAQFQLSKLERDMLTFSAQSGTLDLIFFDAFRHRAQSELWGESVFQKCIDILAPGGYLVTYASKGVVRRTMQEVGFEVEKLPGPPGKREMMRVRKPLAI